MRKRLLAALAAFLFVLPVAAGQMGFLPTQSVLAAVTATKLTVDARHTFIEIYNNDASKTLEVSFDSTLTYGRGRPVPPGQWVQFGPLVPAATASSTTGQTLYGIASSGTIDVRVTEGFER